VIHPLTTESPPAPQPPAQGRGLVISSEAERAMELRAPADVITRNPKPYTLHPKPQSLDPNPKPLNPKPYTLNPEL